MEKETLQQIANRLKDFPYNVKGAVIHTLIDYIKHKEGEDGVKKIEEKIKELGMPINFKEVKSFEWISEGTAAVILVTAKEMFNWTDEEIFEMGRYATRTSFVTKIMARYLVSIEMLMKVSNKYWEKHFDFGSLETEFDKEKNQIIIREKGVKTHPLVCLHRAGYFKGIIEFIIKNKDVTIEETACMHKGSGYNEFVINW